MKLFSKSVLVALPLAAMVTLPSIASAQNWAVFRNCNTRPCTIGVAVSSWYQPGWSRIVSLPSQYLAWQRACYLHNSRIYVSPDINSGAINCNNYR